MENKEEKFHGVDFGKPGEDKSVITVVKKQGVSGYTVLQDESVGTNLGAEPPQTLEDEAYAELAERKKQQKAQQKAEQDERTRQALELAGLPYLNRDVYYMDKFGRKALFYDPKTRSSEPKIMLRKFRQVTIRKNKHKVVRVYVRTANNIGVYSKEYYDVPENAISIPEIKAAPAPIVPVSIPIEVSPESPLKTHGAALPGREEK